MQPLKHIMQLNVERIRVPEVLFQPSIMGIDQAGLIEILEGLLQRLQPQQCTQMLQVRSMTYTHTD
jgi:actin-related protein 5